jgi:hypothetical protein
VGTAWAGTFAALVFAPCADASALVFCPCVAADASDAAAAGAAAPDDVAGFIFLLGVTGSIGPVRLEPVPAPPRAAAVAFGLERLEPA